MIYAKGYGQAHPNGTPVTAQTPFMIGSTTKSVTALAVMQVVIPKQWGMSLRTMAAWYPDCFLLLVGGALLVAVWGVVRPALTLRWARKQ